MTSFLNCVPFPVISTSDCTISFPEPAFARSYGLSTAIHFIFFANVDTIGVLIAFDATKKLIYCLQYPSIIYTKSFEFVIHMDQCISLHDFRKI